MVVVVTTERRRCPFSRQMGGKHPGELPVRRLCRAANVLYSSVTLRHLPASRLSSRRRWWDCNKSPSSRPVPALVTGARVYVKYYSSTCSAPRVFFCLSDRSHGSRPVTGFLCSSVFMFYFCFFLILVVGHMRQTKLASSLVNFDRDAS